MPERQTTTILGLQNMKATVFGIAVFLIMLSSAHALTVQSCGEGKVPLIEVSGPIIEFDLSFIKTRCNPQKGKLFLSINSPGGDVDEAIAVGNWLRENQALVIVRDQAVCHSACVLLVAGAAIRFLDGKIGIHRPYFNQKPNGSVDSQLKKQLVKSRAYLAKMNIREDLADVMFSTTPEEIRVLSGRELSEYRMTGVDMAVAEEAALVKAKKLGITRAEYMRRQQIRKSLAVACGDPKLSTEEILQCHQAAEKQAGL